MVSSVRPVFPEGNQCQAEGRYLIADGADYLVVGYGKGWVYHDSAKRLVMDVAVEMFHQIPVEESGVGFQDHKGNLCQRTENIPASKTLFRQAHSLCHTLKRKHRMKSAKLTLMKTLAIFFQNIKFCKAQSRMKFRSILYFCHI